MREMVNQAMSADMWANMWVTLQEALLGFIIGSVFGLLAGLGIGLSPVLSRAAYPYVVIVQSMPRIALAPVFVALLGFGMGAKVLTAVAIGFFPILINTIVGLRASDEDSVTMMRSMQASKRQIFSKLLWPTALPTIFGGLKTTMTLAFLGAIVGELSAANAGIGMLIEHAAFQLRMEAVFAYLLWLSLVALAVFGLLELLEMKMVFWRDEARRDVFQQDVQ
jgi:NitT/TauT family transport system permease protein